MNIKISTGVVNLLFFLIYSIQEARSVGIESICLCTQLQISTLREEIT